MSEKNTPKPDEVPTPSTTETKTFRTKPEAAAKSVRVILKGLREPSEEERAHHLFISPPGSPEYRRLEEEFYRQQAQKETIPPTEVRHERRRDAGRCTPGGLK